MKKYFDGCNNVVRYRWGHGIELVRYVKDRRYIGGENIYAVRIISSAEDIESFKTHSEAVAFWEKCEAIIKERGARELIGTLYPDSGKAAG